MYQEDTKFHINSTDLEKALKAVKGLEGKGTCKDLSGRHYRWVNHDCLYTEAETLVRALAEWRWKAEVDKTTGDIVGLTFTGEKVGDDGILFTVLAPWVKSGSHIHMNLEDRVHLKWIFKGGSCVQREEHLS